MIYSKWVKYPTGWINHPSLSASWLNSWTFL